jgi:hypothetical protein
LAAPIVLDFPEARDFLATATRRWVPFEQAARRRADLRCFPAIGRVLLKRLKERVLKVISENQGMDINVRVRVRVSESVNIVGIVGEYNLD